MVTSCSAFTTTELDEDTLKERKKRKGNIFLCPVSDTGHHFYVCLGKM